MIARLFARLFTRQPDARILATANRRLQAENERLRRAIGSALRELGTLRPTANGAASNARLLLYKAVNPDGDGDDW